MEESRDVKKANLPLIVLGAIAAVLAIVLAYVWFTNYKLVGQLNEEKEELTQQMISLREDYDTLSSDYDEINAQLDSSREQVNQLIERLKETEARDRAKIRKYEKELGTLRSIMRNYIVQIDSLNTLNKKLTADAAAARREAEVSKARSEELSQKVEHLSGQVAAGSVIKARGLVIEPYDGSGKVNERSSRVVNNYEPSALLTWDFKINPSMKLTLVSEQSGFLSQSHFIKAFREREGCSPARWRKRQANKL